MPLEDSSVCRTELPVFDGDLYVGLLRDEATVDPERLGAFESLLRRWKANARAGQEHDALSAFTSSIG